MQWSEVIKTPPPKHLRQFAGLFLVIFLGFAAWRWFGGKPDGWAIGLAAMAIGVGSIGLAFPAAIAPLYKGWMIAAFPIGWTVSRVVLGGVFFLVITPIAWVFRMSGRDLLGLRRRSGQTYWVPKSRPATAREYFRQS